MKDRWFEKSWLPPRYLPDSRGRMLLVVTLIFVVLPGLGIWEIISRGDWELGIFMMALIYVPLLS